MSQNKKDWEEVLKQDEELQSVAGQEPADTRPLYEQLQEQRAKEEAQYLEKLKVQNRAATLCEEDVEYLEEIERRRREREFKDQQAEKEMLAEFKKQKRQLEVSEVNFEPKMSPLSRTATNGGKTELEKKRSAFGIAPKKKP
jgi:hypothetical protein